MEQNIVEAPILFNAWAWAEKNKKQLIYGAIGLAVAGLVIGYAVWSRGEKEAAAGKELSQAIYGQMGRANNAETAEALLKVAANHAGTPAAAQALLLGANNLFTAAKYPEAQAAFERFQKEYPQDSLVAQAVYGAGTTLAAQGKWDDATRVMKEAVDKYPNAPIAKQAKFALGHAYEMQGKFDLALPLYEDVLRSGGNGLVVNEAAERAEVLRAKLPPVVLGIDATPSAVATNAPTAKP